MSYGIGDNGVDHNIPNLDRQMRNMSLDNPPLAVIRDHRQVTERKQTVRKKIKIGGVEAEKIRKVMLKKNTLNQNYLIKENVKTIKNQKLKNTSILYKFK